MREYDFRRFVCINTSKYPMLYEKKLREKIAKLTLDLEDTRGFLEQEKACSEALRKERTKLRKQVKKLGGEWKDGK